MSWTYTPSATPTPKDYIRFLIGDTQPYDQQIEDEEILAVLADESNIMRAAVTCAETIGGLYARRVSEGNRQAETLLAHYQQLALRLRRKMVRGGLGIFLGGQSLAAKAASQQETDLVQPFFARDQFSETEVQGLEIGQKPVSGF